MPVPPSDFKGRLPSYPGAFYMRHGAAGPTIVGWPKPRGKRVSPDQKAAMTKLTQMTALMKYLDPGALENATELTGRTIALPRDLLLMMLYGRAWTIGIEGIGWIYSLATLQDISFLLDAIGQVPGTMIVRGPDFWDAIEPGIEGQILAVDEQGLPHWADAPTAGTGYFAGMTYAGTAYTHSTTNVATKGAVIRPLESIAVERIEMAGTGAGAAYNVGFSIAHLNNYSTVGVIDAIPLNLQGSVTSTTGPAIVGFDLASPLTLDAGEPYLIAATRLGGLGTAQLSIYTPTFGAGQYRANAPIDQIRSAPGFTSVGLSIGQSADTSPSAQHLIWINGHAVI